MLSLQAAEALASASHGRSVYDLRCEVIVSHLMQRQTLYYLSIFSAAHFLLQARSAPRAEHLGRKLACACAKDFERQLNKRGFNAT